MAFVDCQGCGKKISDRMPQCPHCNLLEPTYKDYQALCLACESTHEVRVPPAATLKEYEYFSGRLAIAATECPTCKTAVMGTLNPETGTVKLRDISFDTDRYQLQTEMDSLDNQIYEINEQIDKTQQAMDESEIDDEIIKLDDKIDKLQKDIEKLETKQENLDEKWSAKDDKYREKWGRLREKLKKIDKV